MSFTNFTSLGVAHGAPRFWAESRRLERIGFTPGATYSITPHLGGLRLLLGGPGRVVSSRRAGGWRRPVLDINSHAALRTLARFRHVRVRGSYGRIDIGPSARGQIVFQRQQAEPPFRVLELFSGGGTMAAAYRDLPLFMPLAGVELDPDFADVWEAANPDATLIQGDIRAIHPAELPRFDVLVAGIPCTDHSTMGRAKKGLAGRPEDGDAGDLFIPVLGFVGHHMPAACLFENVPSFGSSAAGRLLCSSLRRLGYHIAQTILEPWTEWGEPSDRRRWVAVATLAEGFVLRPPMTPFAGRAGDYLDAPDVDRDHADAQRIAGTIASLRAHNARHAALGHGFRMSVINADSPKIPCVPKSYYKINTGPFVDTPSGPRLLRHAELERIMGCEVVTGSYATAAQILGQGVQTRVFRAIFEQLGSFLVSPVSGPPPDACPTGPWFHTDLFASV